MMVLLILSGFFPEVEKLAHGLEVMASLVIILEVDDGLVEDLVDNGSREGIDAGLFLLR